MSEAGSFVYWVGMNTPADADDAALAEFNAFYNQTHLGEVVARHGFVGASRYELLEPDPRNDLGPRWLAIYEMGDQAVADAYVQRNGGPPPGKPAYTAGPPIWRQAQIAWRVIWRPISARGMASAPPESIFVVGMNVPADTDAQALAEFNQFYSEVHVPEVMDWGRFQRGLRFERYREFAHPAPGCPRFAALYEADAASTEQRHNRPRAAMSSGPPTWEQHDTLWRLTYRRLET